MREKFSPKISPELFLVAGLLLLNVFLVAYRFFPTLGDISLWDDAGYINRGKMLAEGIFPRFSDNPFTALLFALSYLPFQHDNFWLLHTESLGRFLMFVLMWLGTYLMAKQAPGLKGFIVVGLMFSSAVMANILENPSDTFYAGLSGLAFWQMLSYAGTRRVGHLAWTSFMIGLAALARNDGLILFCIFLLISFIYLRFAENKLQHLAASILPFLILVGGYVLLYGALTGDYDFGTQERSYQAFRQGQMELTAPDPNCKMGPVQCAGDETDRLYGSSAENGNSILRAILHNPQAYLERLVKTISLLPRLAHDAYGKNTFYALVFLVAAGIYGLAREKKYSLLALCLAWTASLGIYFFTFFRAGYLRMPFFVLFLLAGFGVKELVESAGQKRQWVWVAVLLVLTGIGLQQSLNYFYFSMILLLACILLTFQLKQMNLEMVNKTELALMVFLAGGLIMSGGFAPPVTPVSGQIPQEQAMLVMEERLPQNSLVLAGAPGIVWAARMTFTPVTEKNYGTDSPEKYYASLKAAGVRAIYVDDTITNNAFLWGLIKPGIGSDYEQIYSGRRDSFLVLLVK